MGVDRQNNEEKRDDARDSVISKSLVIYATLFVLVVFGVVFTHFFMGEDLPFLAVQHIDTAEYWGQIGDFSGGILNPLLSFLALLAVIRTMELQRKAMKETQNEARIAIEEQQAQTEVYARQMFDSTFFGMLDAHSKLVENIGPIVAGGNTRGRETFIRYVESFKLSDKYRSAVQFPGHLNEQAVMKEIEQACRMHKANLSHYFRNVYWILKIVDQQFKSSFSDYDIRSYMQKRNYSNILRAQFSEAELAMIQINCLGPFGAGLKYYVEKYSILKPLGPEYFGPFSEFMSKPFDHYAFEPSENIDINGVMRIPKPIRGY